MKSQNDFTNPEEQLRFENEILKLKLETEMGALAINVPDDMPPELANAWLNSIYDFEKNHKNPENKKSVFEHLGKPEFKQSDGLSPDELFKEGKRLMKLLNDHGLDLHVICDYEPKVIYDFILNELFPYEIIHQYKPGGMSVFTYEEFHPNIDHDIRRFTNEFVRQFFNKEKFHTFNLIYLNEIINTKSGSTISEDDCLLLIREVQDIYRERILHDCEIKSITFDENVGKSICSVTYNADGAKIKTVEASFEFTKDEYCYSINRITIPGILEI